MTDNLPLLLAVGVQGTSLHHHQRQSASGQCSCTIGTSYKLLKTLSSLTAASGVMLQVILGSIARVTAERMLKYNRIAWCDDVRI